MIHWHPALNDRSEYNQQRRPIYPTFSHIANVQMQVWQEPSGNSEEYRAG